MCYQEFATFYQQNILKAISMRRTKNQILEQMRINLKQFGIRNSDNSELTDSQILELSEMFQTGFTLLCAEVMKMNDSVNTIISSIGAGVADLGLVADEQNRSNGN